MTRDISELAGHAKTLRDIIVEFEKDFTATFSENCSSPDRNEAFLNEAVAIVSILLEADVRLRRFHDLFRRIENGPA